MAPGSSILLGEQRKLVWLGQADLPDGLAAALDGQWDVLPCPSAAALGCLGEAPLVMVSPPEAGVYDPRELSAILNQIDRSGAVGIILMPRQQPEVRSLVSRQGQFLFVDADAAPADLAARMEAALALQPVIQQLRRDVAAGRSFGQAASSSFEEYDEEMRLAARLQRDFLPRTLPQVGPLRFSVLFRPAGWVSGDIYDVFRLDETHVGFYIADVVGHGLPAALLTMFIKKALQTKRVTDHAYEIVPPEQAMAQLNSDLCQQDLSGCQFCTAFYGVVDTATRVLRYARAGHPAPVWLVCGHPARLTAGGSLLGVLPEETFEPREVCLAAGDRVVAFSDGAEDVLCPAQPGGRSALLDELQLLRDLPAAEAALQLALRIDERRAAGRDAASPADPRDDDVTVLFLDIERSAS